MRYFFLTFAACLLITFSAASEETPTPEVPATVEAPAPTPTRPSDLSSLRVELALSNMDLFPSTDNRIELISALEEDVARRCFGALFQTLYYDPQISTPTCLSVTELALSKDSTNPTALCARYGFEASSCREASLSQDLVDVASAISSTKLDLDMKLAMGRVDQEASATEGELYGISSALGITDEKEKKRAPLRKLVRLRCQFSRSFPKTIVATPTPTFVPGLIIPDVPFEAPEKELEKEKVRSPLDDLIGAMARTPQPTPDVAAKRYRIVSPQCLKAIKGLSEIFPDDSFVPCYREGVYSPRCIEALRVERDKIPASTPGVATTPKYSQSGLEPF